MRVTTGAVTGAPATKATPQIQMQMSAAANADAAAAMRMFTPGPRGVRRVAHSHSFILRRRVH